MAETIPQFQKFLEEMSRELGWTMQYTALYTANWMCRDSMWYTPPFVNGSFEGTTKDAERAGQGALLRDINKLFMPIDARAKRTGAAVILNKLAISAKLTRLMGGDIALDSALGQGSTFTVRLPEMETADDDGAGPAAHDK